MNKPIKIPCLLILNHEEIDQAHDLGTTPPPEERVEHELTFFSINIIETPYARPVGNKLNAVTYLYSNNRIFSSTMKEQQILELMQNAGWYEK